jgi:hypothetical protein
MPVARRTLLLPTGASLACDDKRAGDDPAWAEWSVSILDEYSATNRLYINSIVYTEESIGFHRIEDIEEALN